MRYTHFSTVSPKLSRSSVSSDVLLGASTSQMTLGTVPVYRMSTVLGVESGRERVSTMFTNISAEWIRGVFRRCLSVVVVSSFPRLGFEILVRGSLVLQPLHECP